MNAPVESPVSAVAPADAAAPAIPAKNITPPRPRFQPVDQPARVPRTDGSAISQAVNEVMQVVESLKQTLDRMEEVLELVELAEERETPEGPLLGVSSNGAPVGQWSSSASANQQWTVSLQSI